MHTLLMHCVYLFRRGALVCTRAYGGLMSLRLKVDFMSTNTLLYISSSDDDLIIGWSHSPNWNPVQLYLRD